MSPSSAIRKATPADVQSIHRLLTQASKVSAVLPRSRAALFDTIRDFFVFEEGGQVLACCALHIVWDDLAEIKSLSVDPGLQGKGIGRALANACIEEARRLGLPRVFALTGVPDFFLRDGFREISKEKLPHKVWGDCINCPKYPDCDETAVVYDIGLGTYR
ncbi:MAG: N-acetyltransferase [Candidatus Sumerlaeota bacterium]